MSLPGELIVSFVAGLVVGGTIGALAMALIQAQRE